ncbi:MAG: ABC transporter substrate-binding protein [Lentisphaeria bacterium]|nr:ABC transporter substrate-binding protein [Lentisphaeria bacterium]
MIRRHVLLLVLSCAPVLFAGEGRIVSLSPALTELVCYLGCEKNLVGRSSVCSYPESVKKVAVAGRFAIPYTEKVISLKPDIVITNDLVNPNLVKTFAACRIRCEIMPCRSIAEYRKCVEKLSRLLKVETAGKRELDRIDKKLGQKIKKLNLSVLWVVWDSPLMVAGKNSLPDELLQMAGADNVAKSVPQPYFKCSLDWLLKQKIDVIVWTASPDGFRRKRFWKNLAAVKNNKIIHDLDHDLVQRPGPRIFDGIELLRKKLENMK